MAATRIFVAIPAMDELQELPLTLQDLSVQDVQFPVEVYVCVNQPDNFWQLPEKHDICSHNQALLSFLNNIQGLSMHILDYASPGKGWKGKNFGVGWARKVLFDTILKTAQPDDILISLDADTRIHPGYLRSIAENFAENPEFPAIAVPYYHPLTGDEARDRAILRYEFYMRNYAINLLRIGSPYGFTAIGSAMAMRAGALRKIGGITPLKSGEDFYLMQKFRKMTAIGLYNTECVYPAARYSSRVDFGTGPAMLKGSQGVWDSYPIFHYTLFEPIENTYRILNQLFTQDYHTPFLDFLQSNAKTEISLWDSIRQNVKDLPHFIQAFHEKADGLRILQFLRTQQRQHEILSDENVLFQNIMHWLPDETPAWMTSNFLFKDLSVKQLDDVRNILFQYESQLRKKVGNSK